MNVDITDNFNHTTLPYRDASRARWLWVPYITIIVIILIFLIISFVNFHRKNKWKYHDRQESNPEGKKETNRRFSASPHRVSVKEVVNSSFTAKEKEKQEFQSWKKKFWMHRLSKEDLKYQTVHEASVEATSV